MTAMTAMTAIITMIPAAACMMSTAAMAQPAAAATGALSSDALEEASARGLAWLVAAHHPDGSWGSAAFRGSAAVTAQTVMAFAAAGSTPSSGRHAGVVARGIDSLLACANPDGLIAGNEQAAHGPMYAHAYATMALAEAYGETDDDERVAEILVRARDLIERTQNDAGGWRYQPVRRDADLSVTAAVLVALRALHNSGFAVSEDTVTRGSGYLAGLQNPDGGFRYLDLPGPSGSPRTAAAVFALSVAGHAADDTVERGFAWLDDHPVILGSADGYALYGLSNEAAARWQRGGTRWHEWHQAAAAQLIVAQQADGSWQDPSCAEYGTAAALSVLCMPSGLVPLFQREPRESKNAQEQQR